MLLIVAVVYLTTSQIIISTVGVFSPDAPMGELMPLSEDYPVFILDEPFPDYCGIELVVIFTAFSNASGNIRIHTMINGIENPIFAPLLEGLYFVNYEHVIDTSGLVSGEKEIELFLEDSIGRTKSIVHTVIVDKIPPELDLKYSASRIYHKDPLELHWNITDRDPITLNDYFDRVEIYVDGESRGVRTDRIGSIHLFFFLAIDITTKYFIVEFYAYDKAGNYAYQYLSIEVYRPEEERPPENWEEELAKKEKERIETAWGAGISSMVGAILAVVLLVPLISMFIRKTGFQRTIDANDYEGQYDDFLIREEFDDEEDDEPKEPSDVIAEEKEEEVVEEELPIPKGREKPPKIKKIEEEPKIPWWRFRKRWKQKYGDAKE